MVLMAAHPRLASTPNPVFKARCVVTTGRQSVAARRGEIDKHGPRFRVPPCAEGWGGEGWRGVHAGWLTDLHCGGACLQGVCCGTSPRVCEPTVCAAAQVASI